ncbi:MAG: glycoside hydrolase family 16 protein, partial [Vulcanimicrobiaceae bacterium]
MMRSARLLLVAVFCAMLFAPSPFVRAHESVIEPLETAPPVIARTTVYTFRGEFLDSRNWRVVSHGGAGKGTAHPELQYYDGDAVTVSRGVLHLSALQLKQLDPADGMDYPYVSGRVESTNAYLYGRFDIRVKVP